MSDKPALSRAQIAVRQTWQDTRRDETVMVTHVLSWDAQEDRVYVVVDAFSASGVKLRKGTTHRLDRFLRRFRRLR